MKRCLWTRHGHYACHLTAAEGEISQHSSRPQGEREGSWDDGPRIYRMNETGEGRREDAPWIYRICKKKWTKQPGVVYFKAFQHLDYGMSIAFCV